MTKYDFYWKLIERPKRMLWSFWDYKVMRRDNAYLIEKEVRKHINELVLNSVFEVVKLLGWTEELDDDYYYLVQESKTGKIHFDSCVGGFILLKGKINKFDYLQHESLWNRNLGSSEDALKKAYVLIEKEKKNPTKLELL